MTETVLAAAVPPIPPHQVLVFLLQIALLLLGAFLLGRLAQRLGALAIVGELLTGVLVGPSLLGSLAPGVTGWLFPADGAQMHLLDAVGLIGVLLLVALTGAHLDVAPLRRRGAHVVMISLFGLLVPLGLGLTAGTWAPHAMIGEGTHRWVFALFLGVAMCVSAIPVIAKTLTDMRLLHREIGQLTLAAGTVDDAVGWFLLSIVSAAAATATVSGSQVARSAVYLLGFAALAALVGRLVVRQVLRWTERVADPGPTLATVVVLVLLGAATTASLGMEPIFGAFVVGILAGLPGVLDQRRLAGLRTVVLSVLAPIFMATAGLRVDLTALFRPSVALVGLILLVLAVLGKFIGVYLGARASRLGNWEALAIGAGMNSRGVVEVVVAATGLRLGVLTTATYTVVVLIAIVTSLMAPPMLRWAVNHIEETESEFVRRATQESWAGEVPAKSM